MKQLRSEVWTKVVENMVRFSEIFVQRNGIEAKPQLRSEVWTKVVENMVRFSEIFVQRNGIEAIENEL